ncbi:Fungal specific transcription factor domain containing protein [Hyaloscypha variabilis]
METGPIDGQNEDSSRSSGAGQAKSSTTPKKIACLVCRAKKMRCDGAMPFCGYCTSHSHNCQYATSRQKTGPKKGYLRSLESRLVRAERLFNRIPDAGLEACTSNAVHGVASATPMATGTRGSSSTADQTTSPHSSSSGSVDLSKIPTALAFTTNSHLTDSYPSVECINELHQIYFSKIHPNIPIVHEQRYLSTSLSVSSGAIPACLRYIIWSSAAAISDKYRQDENELYRRARELVQADEMSSYGESAVSLAHCQTWLLIGHYEIKRVLFPRAWLSVGKAVRLAQMLQLFRLDDPMINLKRIVHPPRDWAELEECRHVFWMAFCLDRFASMGTGWPTILDEEDIITNLPLSNESVDNNAPIRSTTLQQACKLENVESLSAQTIVIILGSVAGNNLKHLKRASRIGTNGQSYDFWDAHQDMDTSLLNLGLALPEHLRLPLGIEKPNVVFIHLMLHALTICLHQMAVLKAQKSGNLGRLGTESKERCVASALAITSGMRQANHIDIATMHIYTPFCLFVAARILVERVQFQPSISEYRHALRFLHQVLERLKKTNPLAEIFLVQLRLAERTEEQREDGNNDSKDKAQGDLRSSLSFTHSFQYVPDLMSLSPHE